MIQNEESIRFFTAWSNTTKRPLERESLIAQVRSFQQKIAGFDARGFAYDNENIVSAYESLLMALNTYHDNLDAESIRIIDQLPSGKEFKEACVKANKIKKSRESFLSPLVY